MNHLPSAPHRNPRGKCRRLHRLLRPALLLALLLLSALAWRTPAAHADDGPASTRRLLYVAVPGIRNYLEYGGHGLLVFDIDDDYRCLKRIPIGGVDESGKPLNVKGICASAATGRIHISTIRTLMCLDLRTEKLLWERSYEGGCDRMAVSPDGRTIYLPSLEKDHWHVVEALSGDVLAKLVPRSGSHNTVYGLDGRFAYLAGLRSPFLSVSDTSRHEIVRQVGPFSAAIRPFTVNGRQTLCYVNVNELLGFEIGDLGTGEMLHRVEVQGFEKGPVKRHSCPSHGVGLTPDETQVWVCDAANSRLHVFDATKMPPVQLDSIQVREQPGWITFRLDGRHAWPSTGDVIDVASRQIIAGLTDETGAPVHSEKMVEVHFQGPSGKDPVRTGDQFGLGRVMDR